MGDKITNVYSYSIKDLLDNLQGMGLNIKSITNTEEIKKNIQELTNTKKDEYKDNMKSQEFNESDPCFPNGVFDGYTNSGDIKCTCGLNNKYFSQRFTNNFSKAQV